METNFDDVKVLAQWYKRVFLVAGVWPHKPSNVIFTSWTIYCCIQFSLYVKQIFHVEIGVEMIRCVGEWTWISMVIPKLIVMRFSRKLTKLLYEIIDGMDEKFFNTDGEKEKYLDYNRKAKSFAVVIGGLTLAGVIMHFSMPLVLLLQAALKYNESGVPVITPYRTYVFFDCKNYYTLLAWWIYQIPMILVNAFHPAAIGFVIFLVYHACGQMSALALRIMNLGVALGANSDGANDVFQYIVEKHHTILGLTNRINDVFTMLFLEELLMTTIMIVMTFYTVVVTSDFSDTANLIAYVNYTVIMFVLIYGYCVTGECLMLESSHIYEAYYQCDWHDLKDTDKKQLILCMVGASKPIHLLGGRFYVFSLANFTAILKTAMSYVSLLRTVV